MRLAQARTAIAPPRRERSPKRCGVNKLAFALSLACLFAPALACAQNAYITNAGDNTVSVIATATNTVVATIPVGALPLGIAITPEGSRAYVTSFSTLNVSVIDTATNTVVATIPVGGESSGVAIKKAMPI